MKMADDRCPGDGCPMGPRGQAPERIDIPIKVTGMAGNTTTFQVKDMAVRGMKDKAMIITFGNPLPGAYNLSNDMAYISTINANTMNINVTTPENASLDASGAMVVLSLTGIRSLLNDDYHITEFKGLALHMPDGSVRTYKLDKPVKMINSKDRQMIIWDAYPSFTKTLADALKGGQTFPSGAAPVSIKSLADSEATVTPAQLAYAKPQPASVPI